MNFADIQGLLPTTQLFERSARNAGGETYLWVKDAHQHYFLIGYNPQLPPFQRDTFSGEVQDFDAETAIKWCLPSAGNARKLRRVFPWTAPQPLGVQTSFGCGDRLGLSNAAHIHAARACHLEERVNLVLAQQSMREMERTGRRPDEVLDAATWAVFAAGWRAPWGADADHLKTEADVRRMAEAGFTWFTLDPSAFVDDNVGSYSPQELQVRCAALPQAQRWLQTYGETTFEVEDANVGSGVTLTLAFTPELVQRAAIKYGRAVEHAVTLARVLDELKGAGQYDLELSVDETDSPTTWEEHYFIAAELQRAGVRLTSLAPRFVGEFQKGVNYRGGMEEFAAQVRGHAALARYFGYKISVHSGSDKFAVYPLLGGLYGPLLHVKTAGTWWLEALRTLAQCAPKLFTEIVTFARERFAADRATYHVVEDLRDVPDGSDASLLDHDAARQMLHVTFGSVLSGKDASGRWLFRDRIYRALLDNEDAHFACVEAHLKRHFDALGWCS